MVSLLPLSVQQKHLVNLHYNNFFNAFATDFISLFRVVVNISKNPLGETHLKHYHDYMNSIQGFLLVALGTISKWVKVNFMI